LRPISFHDFDPIPIFIHCSYGFNPVQQKKSSQQTLNTFRFETNTRQKALHTYRRGMTDRLSMPVLQIICQTILIERRFQIVKAFSSAQL